MDIESDVGTEPFAVKQVRKSYVLDWFGHTATLEMVACSRQLDRDLFPAPWRVVDLGEAFVAWRILI